LTRRTSQSSNSQSGGRLFRVEKPRSNHNSPRVMERRKTTSTPMKYATLEDHLNMMCGIANEDAAEDRTEHSRPFSWHPSSNQFQGASYPAHLQDWSRHNSDSSRNSVHGSDFYSLSARNSMHQSYSQNTNSSELRHGSQDSDSSWQQPSTYSMSSISTPATEPMPWYLQEWARKNQAQAVSSQNGSSEFLPIQHPSNQQEAEAEDEEMEDEEEGKELVGMGLYDLPDPALSWSSGLVEGTGKGLKLEETWQPPENDEDEEEDDTSSDDGSMDDVELPVTETTQQQVPVSIKPQTPGNMDGQSFFFDEDETYTKEWWFQQLKQPSMPARDAGIGHGWL
ncbi:hypothetical protein BS50DRAFT_468440, partial [Corynespora cassiicola Philippines]